MADTDLLMEMTAFGPDLVIRDGDIALDGGLRGAVLVSLGLDALADVDDVPLGSDRRGWWSDDVGSKLWLLDGTPLNEASDSRAEEYARAALRWMVDDGVVLSEEAHATSSAGRRELTVRLTRPRETNTFRFAGAWSVEESR